MGDALEECRETPAGFVNLYIFFWNLYTAERETSSLDFLSPPPSLSTHLENFRTKGWSVSLGVLTSYEAKVLPNLPRCFLSCRAKRAVSAGQ